MLKNMEDQNKVLDLNEMTMTLEVDKDLIDEVRSGE
jgi:hypothetical protein